MATAKVQLVDDITGDVLYPETSGDQVKMASGKDAEEEISDVKEEVSQLGQEKVEKDFSNICDPALIEPGYWLSVSGAKNYNASWVGTRGLIKIPWINNNKISVNCQYASGGTYSWQFDEDDNKIAGSSVDGVGNYTFTRVDGADYLYLAVDLRVAEKQVNYGESVLPYTKFNPIGKYLEDYLKIADLSAEMLDANTPIVLYAYSWQGTQDSTHFYGYDAIQDAINMIPANNTRPYIIKAFGRFDLSQTSQYYNPADYAEYHYGFYISPSKRNIHIIGEGIDKTSLCCYLPDNLGSSFGYDKYIGCEVLGNNCVVEGMTIEVRNMRYAVHLDRSGYNYCNGYHITYKNVKMLHLGNTGDAATVWGASPAAFGVGISDGMTITVINSIIEKTGGTPLYVHDNRNFENPYLFEILDTEIMTKGGSLLTLNNLGSGVEGVIKLFGIRNVNGGTVISTLTNSGLSVEKYGIPITRVITDIETPLHLQFTGGAGGQVLKFTSELNGKIVRFDENSDGYSKLIYAPSANVRFRTDGVWEFNGSLYLPGVANSPGWAMGNLPIDVGTDASIQKRLGDCTTNNIILGVRIVGEDTQNIVFNKDYTNYSDADMLAEINSQLSGITASIYWRGADYYPETPNLHRYYSGEETAAIRKGMGVKIIGGSVFRATSNGELNGIALDDINPGYCGRVLKKGVLNTSYYSYNVVLIENDAKNYAPGTKFSISSTPGYFVVDNTNGVLESANYSNVIVDL